jgi:hypothetical protein
MTSTYSPVIIIGMHRSGTTMITRLLETIGLFVGKRKEGNHEAMFFHRINEWLISQCGGFWDHPEPIHELIENMDIRASVTNYIDRYLLQSPRTIGFLGWRKYLRYGNLYDLDFPWGWKSPLNTYTLPLWLDLFPDARVIHIYRHGVDVAQSLRIRGRRQMRPTRLQQVYYDLPFLHWIRPKPGSFIESVRCDSLEGGLSLWEVYLSEARRHIGPMGEQAIEVKYEDFLVEPTQTLKGLAAFCGVTAGHTTVDQVANRVQTDRAYAYRRDPELRAFADQVANRLVAQSY